MSRGPARALLLAPLLAAAAPHGPRVRFETSAGPIVIEVDPRHAPITATNFLRYVDTGKFDGTSFYRAAHARSDPSRGLVQGGINHEMTRSFFPIRHEPTSRTGLHHVDGTVSMARNEPGSAMGDFFVTLGPSATYDANGRYPGYAAFGHVVSGMDVLRRILVMPTYPGGYSLETKGQTLRRPVRIIAAKRVP